MPPVSARGFTVRQHQINRVVMRTWIYHYVQYTTDTQPVIPSPLSPSRYDGNRTGQHHDRGTHHHVSTGFPPCSRARQRRVVSTSLVSVPILFSPSILLQCLSFCEKRLWNTTRHVALHVALHVYLTITVLSALIML
jgi:hypothetical protein